MNDTPLFSFFIPYPSHVLPAHYIRFQNTQGERGMSTFLIRFCSLRSFLLPIILPIHRGSHFDFRSGLLTMNGTPFALSDFYFFLENKIKIVRRVTDLLADIPRYTASLL